MENISQLLKDCLGNEGDTGVELVEFESLMPIKGYIDTERAKAAFERVVGHVSKLSKQFLETGKSDAGQGWTFLNLPFYENGEQWGGRNDAALLCIVCAYYGIVQDPLKTLGFKESQLNELPDGLSYVLFNIEPYFLNLVRKGMDLK